MNWVSGVVLYIIIWWTELFAVLPIGTRPISNSFWPISGSFMMRTSSALSLPTTSAGVPPAAATPYQVPDS